LLLSGPSASPKTRRAVRGRGATRLSDNSSVNVILKDKISIRSSRQPAPTAMIIDDYKRRQFRSQGARLRRRRLQGHVADESSTPIQTHPRSQRHAEVGRAMEEGRRPKPYNAPWAWRRMQLATAYRDCLSRSRPEPTRTARPAPLNAHDIRLFFTRTN